MGGLAQLLTGAALLIGAVSTAAFKWMLRRGRGPRLNANAIALASLQQSLLWSDQDREALREQLATISGALRRLQVSSTEDQIKCDRKMADMQRRLDRLEAKS